MTLEELKKLISKDETKNIELKKSTGELREGMHTACAFLNSDGGVLVFGVTPSLSIVGQIVSESTRRDIAQALAGIEPAVTPNEPQNEHQNEPQKRALTIESLIAENESISINAIAERLNAARITVRRDLKKLGYAWEGASKNGRWVKKEPTSTSW